MKELPLNCTSEEVKGIIEGRKTQLRRIMNVQPPNDGQNWTLWQLCETTSREKRKHIWKRHWAVWDEKNLRFTSEDERYFRFPASVGQRLWVRETWGSDNWEYIKQYKAEPWMGEPDPRTAEIYYLASEEAPGIFPKGYWKPSIHMPQWVSRITLEVIDIRAQRIQDISEEDAWAEGFPDPDGQNKKYPDRARYWFKNLWYSIHGPNSWDQNPFVWAYTFKRVEGVAA